jgi:DMSO/TMAO reductase YedYZ molybdopterin-dependent catalytic subunit
MRRLALSAVVVAVSGVAVPAAPQAAAPATSAVLLRVEGEVDKPLALTAEAFAKLPRRSVEAKTHEGQPARFEGVSLTDVLNEAGAPLGQKLRGPGLARYLVASAADGYRAIFALPELDPAFTDAVILVADRRDGQPLGAEEGLLRLVVPAEKRQARWVRQLLALTVKTVP